MDSCSELRLLSDSLNPQDKLLLYQEEPNHIRQAIANFYVRSPQLILGKPLDVFKIEANRAVKDSKYIVILPNSYLYSIDWLNDLILQKKR